MRLSDLFSGGMVMKRMLVLLLVMGVSSATPLFAQGTDNSSQSAPPSVLPKPLDDEMLKWMIGEWEGWSESKFGKSQVWQQAELGLDGQFIVLQYTAKTVQQSPEQAKAAAVAFGMPLSDIEKLKNTVGKGLVYLTTDPKTGEVGLDQYTNIREVYKATGKREGDKIVFTYEGTLGSGKFTIEKAANDKMVLVDVSKVPSGEVVESRSEMIRKTAPPISADAGKDENREVQNKAVCRRWIEDGWTKSLSEAQAMIDELFDPEVVMYSPPFPALKGAEAYKQDLKVYKAAFPDMHFTIDEMVAEGDKVTCRYTGRGTHRGEFMGIAPSGKQVTVSGIGIVRIVNGRFAEVQENFDYWGMVKQLGATPADIVRIMEQFDMSAK